MVNEQGSRCSNGACVDVLKVPTGVHVVSTIPDTGPGQHFTPAEWDTFLNDVKDGRWDHTYSRNLAVAAS